VSVVASEPFQEPALVDALAATRMGGGLGAISAAGATTATVAAADAGAVRPLDTAKGDQPLSLRVHDPEKHGEASYDAHVTYAITTQTTLASYGAPRCTARRRYQDFVWLRAQLVREYPAAIVPPLPEKHRLGAHHPLWALTLERPSR
jgi:hypothetical protein